MPPFPLTFANVAASIGSAGAVAAGGRGIASVSAGGGVYDITLDQPIDPAQSIAVAAYNGSTGAAPPKVERPDDSTVRVTLPAGLAFSLVVLPLPL